MERDRLDLVFRFRGFCDFGLGGGEVEGLDAEALDRGEDGVEAGSDRGFRPVTPMVLAATQSFQSLKCLFLSRFTPGIPAGRRPPVGNGPIVHVHVNMAASSAANRPSVPWRVKSMPAPSPILHHRQCRESLIFSDQDTRDAEGFCPRTLQKRASNP
jgi:hypothetical protein